MDLFHDILALPGAVGLGLVQNTAANGTNHRRLSRTDRTAADLLKPLRRLLLEPFEALSNTYGETAEHLLNGTTQSTTSEDYHIQALRSRLGQATSYAEWLVAATELDQLEGKDAWKLEEESTEYDVALVRSRLEQMDEIRMERDPGRLLLHLRTALTRNLGGMGDMRLYKHCKVGTKRLIERYIESTLETIDTLVDMAGTDKGKLETQHVLNEMVFARQSFGRSALLLSGGGTFGMNHIGVVKSLFDAQLLPRIISGASAGSIVCAVLCSKTDAEIPDVVDAFCYGDLAVFEPEGQETSLLTKAFRFLTKGAMFDISNLTRVMRSILGDMTFQESYNRTRRILNISVSTASLYELPRLLNYITAPNVMIWSAVAASCSVPFIFSAAPLLAKDPRTGQQGPWNQSPQRWVDGSVDNDLPMTRLAEMFNVNHFIVSQVNPHVVPFLEKAEEDIAAEAQSSSPGRTAGPGWMHTLTNLAKSEALHRMQVLAEMGVMPNALSKVRSVLGQRYSGDITIFPRLSYVNFPLVLTNPTTDFMLQAMLSGEKATWPKLTEIRNHCAIELALDDAVHRLMAKTAFSPSQVDLRRLATVARLGLPVGRKYRKRVRRSSHQPMRSTILDPSPKTISKPFARVRKGVSFVTDANTPVDISKKVAGPEPDEYSSEPESGQSSGVAGSYDSDDEDTMTDTDDESPPSPIPHLWPSTRQLFSFASQPTTPSASHKTFGTPPTPGASSGLTMTPTATTTPSSPELRYKRLFHNVKVNAMQAIRPSQTSAAAASPAHGAGPATPGLMRRRTRSSLDIDISGTKGMMRRRKRSLSTGLRGLWPPGRQDSVP